MTGTPRDPLRYRPPLILNVELTVTGEPGDYTAKLWVGGTHRLVATMDHFLPGDATEIPSEVKAMLEAARMLLSMATLILEQGMDDDTPAEDNEP